MPRPKPGYERPSELPCLLCKGPIEVAPRGRLPEYHAECATLSQDMRRVVASLEAATEGRTPAELRTLRKAWGEVQSGANVVWNVTLAPSRVGRD